jgi:hypothetical protein
MPRIERSKVEQHIARPDETFDVVVAGGGPAGIGAALAAATNGAKTLLLEEKAFFGGVAAVSGWMPFNRLLLDGGSRGGVHELFVAKVKSLGPDAWREGKKSWVDGDGLHIHPDYLRLAVLELMEETGCKYRLHSPVTGAVKEGDRVTAALCDGKYGRACYPAKAFVDATGDGDLSTYAGACMRMGRETDGMFMPVTLGFVLGDVDEDRLFEAIRNQGHAAYTDRIKAAEAEGYSVSMFYSFDRTTIPGLVSVNNGGQRDLGVVNAMDLVDVNMAERTGLQVAVDFVRISRAKKLPGLENCRLVRTGAALGVRETRRIEGDYTLTLEDAQEGRHFSDVVAVRYGTIDPGGLQESRDFHGTIKNGNEYPYRAMLPAGVEGLLAAGRCASLTHLGLTVCKSMGNMMGVGQAAGVAAALAALRGVTPRQLDPAAIQKRLAEMNVALPVGA